MAAPLASSIGTTAPGASVLKPLRLLCLHGFGGSADIFRAQTGRLRALVEETGCAVEWDFVSSPVDANWDPAAYEARLVTSFFPGLPNRQWMRRVLTGIPDGATILSTGEGLTPASLDHEYADWREPLAFLLGHIKAHGPYDGVVGFSQGANMATLLAAVKESGAVPGLDFKACVLVAGSAFGWDRQWSDASKVLAELPPRPLFAAPLVTPSLHLVADGDPMKPASEALAALYRGAAVHLYQSSHKPPTQKTAGEALVKFLKTLA